MQSEIVEPFDKEIDGRTYRVTPFLGRQCLMHYAALVKIIGEPLAHGLILAVRKSDNGDSLAYIQGEGIDKDMKEYVPAVATAFATLTEKLNPQDLLKLITALLKNTSIVNVDGPEIKINIDLHFGGGRMKPLFKLLLLVLEVNFADFLGGLDLRAIGSAAMARASMSLPSPQTSTGTSGVQ